MNLWFILFLLWCMVGFATPRTVNKAKNTKLRNPSPQFDILKIIDKEEHTLPPWALEEVYSMATNTLSTPPPCIKDESDLGYVSGMLSATQTFYNCLNAITDPMSLPNFYNGTANGNVTVYTSIQLNNLHQVDAVTGTITVDFYLRLYWQDNRFAMPLFWNRVDPKIRKNGFEITPLITNGNTTTVGVFMPDIRFHDAAELDYIVQTIRFNSSNVFFWSRHTVATFMQPKMTFDRYPADSQIFHLRYGSYAYDQTWLRMGFTTNPAAISMNLNYDGSATFLSNPEWQYSADSTSYETYISSSGFVNAIYHIGIRRRGSGIVLRLILPITLLCFLGGLTFWAEFSSRVNSTITLLLSVSALYIVILANIPLVGYLTEMDTFIFWMFLLLVFAVILHQIYATIQEENDIWPLRIFYGRFIEFLGRIGFFPLVTFFFLYHIGDVTPAIERGLIAVTIIIGTFILIKEGSDLKAHYKLAVKLLLQKLNSEDLLIKDLSPVELLLVNNLKFQKLSTSPVYVAEYLEIIGGLDIPKSRSLPLRRYSAGRQLSKRKITVPDDLSEEDDEIEQISREASLRAVEIVHERQKSGYYHFQKSSSQDEEEIKQIQKEASLRAVQIVKERQRSGSYHFSRTPSKDNVEIEPVQRQESLRQDSLRAVQIIQERQKSGYYRFFSRSPSENVKHEMTYKGLKSVNSGDRASGGFVFQEENPQRVNTQPHITLEEETIQAVTRKESNSSLTSATITQPSPLRSSLRSKSLGSPVKESMSEKKTVVFSDNNPRDFGLQDHSLDNHDGENEKSSFNY